MVEASVAFRHAYGRSHLLAGYGVMVVDSAACLDLPGLKQRIYDMHGSTKFAVGIVLEPATNQSLYYLLR